MNDTKMTMVCDFFKEITQSTRERYSVALVMDFNKVLKAKLANPDAVFHQAPSSTTLRFYPRNIADDLERPLWRAERDGNPESRILLPDGVQRLWRAWAPCRLSESPSAAGLPAPVPHAHVLGPEGRVLDAEVWPEIFLNEMDSEDDLDVDDSEEDDWSTTDAGSDDDGSDVNETQHAEGSGEDVEMQSPARSDDGGQDEGSDEAAEEPGNTYWQGSYERPVAGATSNEAAPGDGPMKATASSVDEAAQEGYGDRAADGH